MYQQIIDLDNYKIISWKSIYHMIYMIDVNQLISSYQQSKQRTILSSLNDTNFINKKKKKNQTNKKKKCQIILNIIA